MELEDTRVCQTRLSGRTVAFGTAAGIVVLVDLEAGTVLDGFDAHTDEITALEWAGSEKLISGGAGRRRRRLQPSRCGESSLFELVEVDDFEDDFDDDEEDAGVLDSLYDALDALQDGHDADADAALAAALFGGDYYPVPKDDRIIIEHQRDRVDVADVLGEMTEAPESDGEPDVVLRGHSARVTGVRALDAKASKVLSASLDRRVLLWDVEQGDCREVAVAPSAICCLAVADGVAVVGLLDGSVEGYDLEDGARVFRLEDAHEGAVRSVHFGDDGASPLDDNDAGPRGRLLCTGGADGVVKCYTMRGGADGEPLQPQKADGCPLEAEDVPIHFRGRRSGAHALRGHAGAVVAVQADDTKLVSASIDGSVRCWDLRTGAQLFALDGHSRHITSLHFEDFEGPDGKLVSSSGLERAELTSSSTTSRAKCGVDAPRGVDYKQQACSYLAFKQQVAPFPSRSAFAFARNEPSSSKRTPVPFAIASRLALASFSFVVSRRSSLFEPRIPCALPRRAPRALYLSPLLLVVGVELLLAFLLRAAVPPVDVEIRRPSTRLRPHDVVDALRPEARRRRVPSDAGAGLPDRPRPTRPPLLSRRRRARPPQPRWLGPSWRPRRP